MTLTVIILTYNEAHHIQRALTSVETLADSIYVIDSQSIDDTTSMARAAGATVLVNPFVNQAQQFNWALDQLPPETDWVMRLDADEIITPKLTNEIMEMLPKTAKSTAGIYVSRRMTFLRRPIQWGGIFPAKVLRLFRYGKGQCENRWMDEHIIVEGDTLEFEGEIVDDNKSSLTWWTEKHNSYASREVVDILNQEFEFMPIDTVADLSGGQAGVKRWIKEYVYASLPGGFRAFLYFFYRYFLRLGFLDGPEGAAFHFLQGFWYRYLVDAKLFEVKKYMNESDVDVVTAIRDVLNIDVTKHQSVQN